MKKWFAPLLALLFVMLPTLEARAAGWCSTRNKCKWWAKKYTANADVHCIGLSLPLCYQHQGHCDSASASCSWRSCPVGGASAWASNGPSGCYHGGSRTGMGLYGTPASLEGGDEKSSGSHEVLSHAVFDDLSRSITLTLDRGYMTATADTMVSRFDVYVFREDVKEGQEVDEPVRTPENTRWHGSIVLQGGRLTVEGFDPTLFKVSTDRAGLTTVTFAQVKQVIRFDVSAEDFENLVVQSVADGNTSGK
ncbi:hypothetical protein [Archangium sp.]|jgi:hypothetical protein|uniref:hypothetical protein n=1 Tax=Archangium sp. TaxID=1872627 RepID=UPI002ED824BB